MERSTPGATFSLVNHYRCKQDTFMYLVCFNLQYLRYCTIIESTPSGVNYLHVRTQLNFCLTKFSESQKYRTLHTKGRTPVCTGMCRVRL